MRLSRRIVPLFAILLVAAVCSPMVLGVDAPDATKGKITGKVVDASGNAVADVKVMLHVKTDKHDKTSTDPAAAGQSRPMADGQKTPPAAETTTDSAGKFTMGDIDPGTYTVGAHMKGKGHAREEVTVVAGKEVDVVLTLQEGKPK